MTAHHARSDGPTVLVIASGKGGTGTSLVAALLALAVAGEGWRVLLVDGTESWGALHVMLGVTPRGTLADDVADADALLTPVADTLALVAGGEAPDATAAGAERERRTARVAALHDGFDLVVVDAGSRLEPVLAACAAGATRLLVVATEDQIAMAAAHALLKAVEARRPGLAVDVVVNRATDREALAVHDSLATAAERFLGRAVGLAGAIPDDPCLQGGVGAGMTVQDAAAGSPAALAARGTGLQLLNDGGELARRSRRVRAHARNA